MTIKIETVTIEMDEMIWDRICELADKVKVDAKARDFRKAIEDDEILFEFVTDIVEINNWLNRAKIVGRGER